MRRVVLFLLVTAACKAKPPLVDKNGDPPTGLSLTPPACLTATTTDGFSFTYAIVAASTVVAEVDASDGASTVIFRETVAAGSSGTITVPGAALRSGANSIFVWSYASAHASEAKTFIVNAVVPADPQAPTTDADGDCWTVREGDCNDSDPAIHPGADEVCNNKVDDNCNGLTDFHDLQCKGQCNDADNDGYASVICGGDDCDDANPAINPGQTELCNGVDDNCNGKVDEIFDTDGDGFVACPAGTSYVPIKQANGNGCPAGYPTCADCDDSDVTTYPGAFEPCDAKVHSCNPAITVADKDKDDDGDGYKNCEDPDSDNDGLCDVGAAASLTVTPCADPSQPDGLCCSGTDNCKSVQNYVQSDYDGDGVGDACDTCSDLDGDGYGRGGTYQANPALPASFTPIGAAAGHPVVVRSAQAFSQASCASPGSDCDDNPVVDANAATVNPGAVDAPVSGASPNKFCDGIDNNCDGTIDEGFDADADTYTTCGGTSHLRTNGGATATDDCNDGDSAVHPGASEVCNGKDDNCVADGFGHFVDETADLDGDGWTSCTGTSGMLSTGAVAVGAQVGDDCNDSDAAVHPGASEVCNGKDDNCLADGFGHYVDETFDADGDTWTTCTSTSHTLSTGAKGGVGTAAPVNLDDCKDTGSGAASVHPTASEVCNGQDDDCLADGFGHYVDEPFDLDGDGWTRCTGTTGKLSTGPKGGSGNTAGVAQNDCYDSASDPNAALMFPTNTEICDGLDNNCSCPYGAVYGVGIVWPPSAAGYTTACIDEGWDSDNDGFAGVMASPPGAQCPAQLALNTHGIACVSSVKKQLDTTTGVVSAYVPSCYDCNQCGGTGEVACGTAPAGSGTHPTASGQSTTEASAACSDLFDNDCDGFVDGLDADCTACPNQTLMVQDDFSTVNGIAAPPGSFGTNTWEQRSAAAGPTATSFSEGRGNKVFGTDGNHGNSGYETEDSRWSLGRSATAGPVAPGAGNPLPFNFTGSSGKSVYIGARSWTFNSGYPSWTSNGASPENPDGGNCIDPRNKGWTIPYDTMDSERLRVAIGSDGSACTNDAGAFTTVLSCQTTPDLGKPYDGKWRVLRGDVTAQLAGQSSAFICGRFTTGGASLKQAEGANGSCFGGNGTTLDPWNYLSYWPDGSTGYPACSASKQDDGWYIDDLVVYSCDYSGLSCTGSQFDCNGSCCDKATQYCNSGTCSAATGSRGCNQTQCAAGYHCSDFQNSRCDLNNTAANCGEGNAACSGSQTCAYDTTGTAEVYPTDAQLPSDCIDVADGTPGSVHNAKCKCVNPSSDRVCGGVSAGTLTFDSAGTLDYGVPARGNCTRFGSGSDYHCRKIESTFFTYNCSDFSGGGATDFSDCACVNF